jgi:hypothetical protein
LVVDKRGGRYQLQTKASILDNYLPANDLGSLEQRLAQIYAAEISSANRTTKISLRSAAREGRLGQEYIPCGCKKVPCGNTPNVSRIARSVLDSVTVEVVDT